MARLFIHPFECENQSRVIGAMEHMATECLDAEAVVGRIRDICYKMVFNQEDRGLENIDLSNASEVSAEMLLRILRQELPSVTREIDNELEVACAEMYDPMVGFLVYITVLFLWKFIVQLLQLKFFKKYESLEQRKQEFFGFYLNTAVDNKDQKPLDTLRVNLIKIIADYISKINGNLKSNAIKNLQSEAVKRQYDSVEINKILTKKYFLKTNPNMFEETFAYMRNPLRKYDEYIEQNLNKKYFVETVKNSQKRRKEEIEKVTQRTLIVVDLLEETFSGYLGGKTSIFQYFTLYTDSGKTSKIEDVYQKQPFEDKLAQICFDIIYKIVTHRNVRNSQTIAGTNHVAEFVIPRNVLT
ncbi:MAG: hypothetical protein AAFO91_17965, partial [Bacteroidota bacterium]